MDNKIDKIKINNLIHKIGLKYNIRDVDIKEIVSSPSEFCAEKLRELDLKSISTEEELNELKTTFIFKSFCKLYISFALINRRNKQRENKFKLK